MRWLLWLLLSAAVAYGQERFHLYNTDNGLPNNSVLALRQASDGYLWFTTYRGIVRFDGVRFEIFDGSNTPAIHGTTFVIFCLMEDHQGALWAGAWNGGALRYYNGTFSSITSKDGLPNNQVLRIDEDDQGTIWFFTGGGLARLRSGKVEAVQTIDGEPVQPYLKTPPNLGGETHLFGLWRLGRGRSGLQRFAYGKWSDVPLPPEERNPAAVRMEVAAEDSQRRLWYTIMDRPGESFCVQNGRLTVFRGLPPGAVASYQDRFGRLWTTDQNGHAALWQDGRTTPLSGMSSSSPLRVLEDTEGSFWVGTLNQGLVHAPLQLVRSMRLPGGPGANTIKPIIQDHRGDIWVGSVGLTRMHAGRFETYPLPSSMAQWRGDQEIWSLWADPDGTVFFSNNTGPKIFRDGKFFLPELPLQRLTSRVNAIIRDTAGNLWMGNERGVFLYRDSKLTLIQTKKGLPLRGEVRALAEDKTGTVWVGTDAVLCRFRNAELSCFGSTDVLSPWPIRSITVDRDNVVWAGTADHGILRIKHDSFRWIQSKDGLFSNDATGILEDHNGYFWIGSRVGIVRVQKQELNAFAEGRANRVTSSYFGKSDGLNDSNCAGFGQPHGFVAQDGTLWFPTGDGLANLDPKVVALNNSRPRVQIASCSLEQQRVPCDRAISLPPEAGNFEITYTALNLVRSNQIQFRYRLEGLDTTWVEAGNRRTAYYPHLPPGNYRFLVTGANSFGTWSADVKELSIAVQPRYYQTLWFRYLAATSLIVGFLLMWRLRGIQYYKRQAMQRAFAQQIMASQETERKRIAGELHDSLGQRLTVIKNMALLLNRPDGRNRQHQIEAIASETAQAIAEVRNISHNLRPYQLDLLGLKKAIEFLIARTCETSGIRADVVVDDLSGAFCKESEIHFYRIVQECLNNIAKHSKATTITILVQSNAAGVSLVVSDDGVGFLSTRPNGDGKMGGFGLTGICERARLLGGKASIRSAPGQGTTVTIEIEPEAMESGKLAQSDA
jgi:signal transduction histidine kinase/ligand-binding sensor domain-containing protein